MHQSREILSNALNKSVFSPGSLATDALLIGALSVAGYGIAFAYEAGYAKHFGYPSYLISPTPSVIAVALGAVFGLVIGLFPILINLFGNDKDTKNRAISFIVFVIFIPYIFFYEYSIRNYEISSIWSAFAVSLAVLIALFVKRRTENYFDARLTNIVFSLGLGGLSLASAAFIIGIYEAKGESSFYFLKDKPDYAVVRLYESMAIAVRYDFDKKNFEQEYYVLKIGDEKSDLEMKRVGVTGKRLPIANIE